MGLYAPSAAAWNTIPSTVVTPSSAIPAGTVMHRTRLPLTLWFWAIYLCATDKRGISAVQLSHTLGICYDSAWHLLDRIRTAMGQRDEKYLLSGIVELDDGYVGGPSHNGKRGRGTDKAKIVVAVSKAENGVPLFARMKAVENVQGKTLQEIIDQYFAPNTKVECDGYRSYVKSLIDVLFEAYESEKKKNPYQGGKTDFSSSISRHVAWCTYRGLHQECILLQQPCHASVDCAFYRENPSKRNPY